MKSRIKYSCATKWNKYIYNERKKHVYNCHMFLHSISFIFPLKYYLVFTLQEFFPSLLARMLSNVHPCLNISVYLSI